MSCRQIWHIAKGHREVGWATWTSLPLGTILSIVLGWAPIGFAVMATPRPSQWLSILLWSYLILSDTHMGHHMFRVIYHMYWKSSLPIHLSVSVHMQVGICDVGLTLPSTRNTASILQEKRRLWLKNCRSYVYVYHIYTCMSKKQPLTSLPLKKRGILHPKAPVPSNQCESSIQTFFFHRREGNVIRKLSNTFKARCSTNAETWCCLCTGKKNKSNHPPLGKKSNCWMKKASEIPSSPQ